MGGSTHSQHCRSELVNKQAQYWYEAWQQQQRNTQELMFENAQLYVMVRSLLPALFTDAPLSCEVCGITLPPQGRLYCSQRCNQRAYRARLRAAA